jgi:predicted nucleotidyltransferase
LHLFSHRDPSLFGSLATGAFDDDVSDIDLIAVLNTEPDAALVSRLGRMHKALIRSFPAWDDRIEVNYVSSLGLAECRTRNTEMARISPGEPLHLLDAGRDFILDWYPARAEGVALLGPPIASLIPQIPQEEYAIQVRARLAAFLREVDGDATPGFLAYAILTTCRGLYTLTTGSRPSKAEAAEKAQREFPSWSPLIDSALRQRQHTAEQATDELKTRGETRAFIAEMLSRSAHPPS